MKRPRNTRKRDWRPWREVAARLTLAAILLSAPIVEAQTSSGTTTGAKFEVLDVTTGSGSKSQGMDKTDIVIEAAGSPKAGNAAPQSAERPDQMAADTPLVPLPPRNQGGTVNAETPKPAKETKKELTEEEKAQEEQRKITNALEGWHHLALENYNYNILSLIDPFMPIKEVRGRQEENEEIDPRVEATLPPILRLELNQLKLVAITVLSSSSGGALASFEDGAGASYILRQGDRIGRRKGVITSIAPTTVTVEEPPRGEGQSATITEIKLNTLSTDGFSRSKTGS